MKSTVLARIGFKQLGSWTLSKRVKSCVSFTLRSFENKRGVYALVAKKQVKYIGICDKPRTTLPIRMKRYKYAQGYKTNGRIVKRIKESLRRGEDVQIHALVPTRPFQYRGLEVDLTRGPFVSAPLHEWNII